MKIPNTNKVKKRKGFSLVEVIIALGIVALLLTGFLGVFGSAQRNINRSIGVKEANLLKDSLENEMSVLRASEYGTSSNEYTSAFAKAFDMIKTSTDPDDAILIYQYKAVPEDDNDDGVLPPYTANSNDAIQGAEYITQVAVRKKGTDDVLIAEELKKDITVGGVYAVRMTQLIKDTNTGDLILSTDTGKIMHLDETSGNYAEAADATVYNSAVITFQAEFFKLPSNSAGYVNSGIWDFTKLGAPAAVINLAVRR